MNNLPVPSYVPDSPIVAGTPRYIFQNLFGIQGFDFRVYSFMIMLGIIASILTILFFWYRENYKTEILLTFVIIVVPLAIIGARLGYVVEALLYEAEPFKNSHWYAAWDGGLSIQGGIILAGIGGMLYGWIKRDVIDFRKVISMIIPTILIGQFVGRWGNFANHELYGKIDWSGKSSIIWSQVIADNMYISDSLTDSMNLEGAYRYPLFLYEGLANLFGFILIVWVFNLCGIFKPGTHATFYLIWYGTVRLALEPLRQDSFGLYTNVSLVFIILGTIGFIYFQFLSRVKYDVKWVKYRWVYSYTDELKYLQYVSKTSPRGLIYSFKDRFLKNKLIYKG